MHRVELDAGFRLAVFIGSLMHHEDFLFGTDAREVAVVSDSYEQSASAGIGKCRHRLGQFAGIGHTILEVLLLVFALADEVLKIAPVVHWDGKIKKGRWTPVQRPLFSQLFVE